MKAEILQTHRFLQVIAGSEPITLQTFSDREDLKIKRSDKKVYDPNAKVSYYNLAVPDDLANFERLNTKGVGVFVMVNEGNGMGRTAQNVVKVRALFVDTDGAPYPNPLPLEPHLVVESSPGRWHLYWLVQDVPLEHFSTFQKTLAKHYGTDPSINDLPRVMRLPGFYHCKGKPYMVRLLEANEHPRYNHQDVLRAWPCLSEALDARVQDKAASEAKRQRLLELAQGQRKRDHGPDEHTRERLNKLLYAHRDAVASAPKGQRHETLKNHARALGGYVGSATLTFEEAQETLATAAEVCGLPESEASDLIRWGLEKGQLVPLTLEKSDLLLSYVQLSNKPRTRRSRQIARMRKRDYGRT